MEGVPDRYLYRDDPGRREAKGAPQGGAPRAPERGAGRPERAAVFTVLAEPCEKERGQPLSAATGSEKFCSRFRFPSLRAARSAAAVQAWLPRLQAPLGGAPYSQLGSPSSVGQCLWVPAESVCTESW